MRYGTGLLNIIMQRTGAYLGFCQGGCTFLADLPPTPDLALDPDPHQDFELDPDPAPDPHQNNADPEPWAQLSKERKKERKKEYLFIFFTLQ